MRRIREIELKYEQITQDQFPYTRMKYFIIADGIEIETGELSVREMWFRYYATCEASLLPLC